jgi:DNA-binding transcriptional LysR family regulator
VAKVHKGMSSAPTLELRYLVALVTVGSERSFGRAADRLGYTQSAVSQQIAALERSVGLKLVERPGGRRPVELTEAGERLARHAESIVSSVQLASAEMASLADGRSGRLRVGIYQSIGVRMLPAIVRRLAGTSPELELETVESGDDVEQLERLAVGELDLSFTVVPLEDERFETLPLKDDPFCLVVPADSELAARGDVELEEIAELDLVSFRSCRCERYIEEELADRGIVLEPFFRSDDNGVLQALVAAGSGSALMPRLAVDESDEHVSVIDLNGRVRSRRLALAWSRERGLPPAGKHFIDAAVMAEVAPALPR